MMFELVRVRKAVFFGHLGATFQGGVKLRHPLGDSGDEVIIVFTGFEGGRR